MTSWFASAVALLSRPIHAAQARLLDGSGLASCRACGERKPKSEMSEIPYHGFFCNDDEAAKYWNEHYEFKTDGSSDEGQQSTVTSGRRFSQPS